MDFDDTPEEAAIRLDARRFLDAHAARRPVDDSSHLAAHRPNTIEADRRHRIEAADWQQTKLAGGWGAPAWPVEQGGRGLGPHLAAIFAEEERDYDVRARYFQVGLEMVGPTLLAHGSAPQLERFLQPLLRGDEMWCQLFSEPGAGSDLAGLATRAVRDGDEYVISGQKVWTTAAHLAEFGILLARTDPDVPKHRGISAFLVDMSTQGIDVRPLRQIDGAVHFSEVFFDEVRVGAGALVGGLNAGWGVALTMLNFERSAIGGGGMIEWPQIVNLARDHGVVVSAVGRDRTGAPKSGADAGVVTARQDLARLWSRLEILRFLGYRVRTAITRGEPLGPESSVMKLAVSGFYEDVGNVLMSLQGADGMLWGDADPNGGVYTGIFLAQWAPRIGGGTDQVQRNIIGERVLGLPPEARPDKAAPFKDLPRS
ncbi:acyl-CoA dehydrogenase family protein [Candidatus Microthrix parvicella]|uniref:acyl-CoA dehydrogenase family protein n=1 Tax=Candidatus Neomicrothrix parvicella TaxID=41950 RepID=UPI000365AE5F|nr:acyl-CoA dehydrogenase family protein [Candidatus Microthrix parvicella]